MTDTRPRYRIQAVAQMTDVPAPTLRAWERRYGIPRPQRTDSAYRLYSDQDIEHILRLRAYCDQGMAPSEAAALVARQEDPQPTAASPEVSQLHLRLVDAIEAYDERRIQALLSQALLIGAATQVYDEVIGPAMREVGDRWHAGKLSVAQEHLATSHFGTAARALLRLTQPTAPNFRVLLACCAGERHSLPLYGAALRFASWGFYAIVLGADTPAETLTGALAGTQANLVGLSLTAQLSASQAGPLLTGYAAACGAVPWLLGGAGAEPHRALVESLGGHVAPTDPGQLRQMIDPLVRRSNR